MAEENKKCRCGKPKTPGRGDYCLDCYFDAFGDELDEHPVGGHRSAAKADAGPWSDKYAVVLEIQDMPVLGVFIANTQRPYRIPAGKENMAHNLLQKRGKFVVVADKKTLLENPFDLCEDDFDAPLDLEIPEEAQKDG